MCQKMKKKYFIECEIDYDYLKDVWIIEKQPDGTEKRQSLPKNKENKYILEIDVPENVFSNSDEMKINSKFGLTLPEIRKRIDFYERHKYNFKEGFKMDKPRYKVFNDEMWK